MKKLACYLLAITMLLVGCTAGEPAETTEPAEDISAYLSPWEEPIQADGKLHYYFMSGAGMIINPEHSTPEKWGDSCLILFPDGKTMLVDSGQRPYAPVLVENLRRMGIEKLDYIMISHSHSDHIYGVADGKGVLANIPVGEVLISGVYNGGLDNPYLVDELCKEKGIPVRTLEKGDVLELGEVRMEVIWPRNEMVGQVIKGTEEVNNESLVVRFDYKEHSSLFTGDLYAAGEEELLKESIDRIDLLDADLLKIPHHGHNTSSTVSFVMAVRPEIAVAMGYCNMAGSVRNAYLMSSTDVVMDRNNGYVHIYTDGQTMMKDVQRSE